MELFAIKKTKEENILRLVMGKKYLDDNKVAIVAHGYEGGGCWTDWYAVLQLDEFGECVEEIIESFAFTEDDYQYEEVYQEIQDYLEKYIDFLDGEAPCLNSTALEHEDYNEEEGSLDLSWDWDSDVHVVLSQDWPFFYRWEKDD
jgi:hypothetical protein